MKVEFSPRILVAALAITCAVTLCVQASVAQSCSTLVPTGTPTCTQVFSAVNVRTAQTTAGYTGAVDQNNNALAPDIFGSSTVSLTCTASPIIATLSGPLMNTDGTAPVLTAADATPPNALQAGGSLLVDNNLWVGVNGAPPTDVCTGFNQGGSYQPPTGPLEIVPPGEAENCFELPYAGAIGYPTIPSPLNGDDTDTTIAYGGTMTVDAVGGLPVMTFPSGGVGSIDISGLLTVSSTPQNVMIQLQDDGGILNSSSIFLATNCTVGPVTGPALVTGNTITPSTLTQTFNFNANNGNVVGFVYDLGPAAGTLIPPTPGSEPTPQTADLPVDPAAFQPYYAEYTSFATSNCQLHSGEALASPPYPLQPNGQPPEACKLYTLECTTGTSPKAAGALCPVSTVANEVVQDAFDGPSPTLQDIYTPFGMFREGIGLLMASETWGGSAVPPTIPTNGGPCTFDEASGLQLVPCPQNLLISFSGPGKFTGDGETTNPNSAFISVYGVPQDLTLVNLQNAKLDNWVNTSTPHVGFISSPPNFSHGAFVQSSPGGRLVALPNAANFRPAPIQSITYGISPLGKAPLPINEPIITGGSVILTGVIPTGADCAAAPFTALTQPTFKPPKVTLPSLPDDQYALYYYAQDCAGTQELLFTDPGGTWATNFYTFPIKIDTVPPTVSVGVTGGGSSFKVGVTVFANYECTDPTSISGVSGLNTGSGLTHCGTHAYAPETTYDSGPLSSKLNTSSVGNNKNTHDHRGGRRRQHYVQDLHL